MGSRLEEELHLFVHKKLTRTITSSGGREATKLEVTFLGTSSATPTKTRSLPSIAITRDGQVTLMDCGEGAQARFVKFGLGLNREMLVLMTHLHGDHVNGLLGLLQTMSMSQRIRTLTIVAPRQLFEWLKITMRVLHIGLSFQVLMVPVRSGVVLRGKDFRIRAEQSQTTPSRPGRMSSRSSPRPGVFDPNKALALGVPEGKKWSSLQRGRRASWSREEGPSAAGSRAVEAREEDRLLRRHKADEGAGEVFRRASTCSSSIPPSHAKDADKAVERRHSTAVEAAQSGEEGRRERARPDALQRTVQDDGASCCGRRRRCSRTPSPLRTGLFLRFRSD